MKTRIPKFKSLEEERKFWYTHDITEFLEELRPVKVKFIKPKKKLISLRLETNQIDSIREIASRKGLAYLSLLRYWITERLSRERHTVPAHHH